MNRMREIQRVRKKLCEAYHELSDIIVKSSEPEKGNVDKAFEHTDEAIIALNRELGYSDGH